VSSKSGSADVLNAARVNLNLTPAQVGECINNIGIGFLFALPPPGGEARHRPTPRLGVRTDLQHPRPLTNPAGARRQLMGVYAPELTEPLANVLCQLAAKRRFVVHGHGERTRPLENRGQRIRMQVRTYTLDPQSARLQAS